MAGGGGVRAPDAPFPVLLFLICREALIPPSSLLPAWIIETIAQEAVGISSESLLNTSSC